ncbi:alpha-(1,3)-fucosyltransferase 10 isoform X1 [Rhincodon typus]|uniref:alpha-(1,3)-fucosyltransferase 10 isoform X1 n=1 Tax=Rhincodon typus TaxID=259920 RepID=UPI00202E1366|nr:alpha-(1,3)-fucosyltransferase 10 isoform X1 [Rhincodon typus]
MDGDLWPRGERRRGGRTGLRPFWLYCLCCSALLFLIVTLQVVVELGQFEKKAVKSENKHKDGLEVWNHVKETNGLLNIAEKYSDVGIQHPIIVWWSPLTGELGRIGRCGADTCYFTINKTYQDHQMTRAFLFYGTDFQINSLPLPRKHQHEWALFHEESPKNNYKLFHEPTITLFNYTSTFSRNSHMPLTTQYLESIEELKTHKYLIPLSRKNQLREHLAPLVYVQSDCDPPSDRDSYVRELMKYIPVDSYGACLHNKDLPSHLKDPTTMDDDGLYKILAQYKFILAFENAVCDDYITEKLWRSFKLGVVPVYYGSPSVADWLPSNKSAILVEGFSHPKELAEYIMHLDSNDQEYGVFLEWKWKGPKSNEKLLTAMKDRKWGVRDLSRDNYIDAFECLVCNSVWENHRRKEKGLSPIQWRARANHLSCPEPVAFTFLSPSTGRAVMRELWLPSFHQSKREAAALRRLVERNRNFTTEQFWRLVFEEQL